MQLRRLIVASVVAVVFSGLPPSVNSMEISVGKIRVQTDRSGELYVDTPRGRVYIPPEDDYYEDGDYYEDDYDYYDDYCSGGRRVVQRQVQRSGSGRQESYSSVYTSDC